MSGPGKLKKIADLAGREDTPLRAWIRRRLLFVKRENKDEFNNNMRYPVEMAARDQPDPNLPMGVHHKLHQNAYLDRDARRSMTPPSVIYDDLQIMLPAAPTTKPSLGPSKNFGLPTPVPGFGYEWKREIGNELPHTQRNTVFRSLERYDGYSSSQ